MQHETQHVIHPMKNNHSLKVDVPPPEELRLAEEKILNALSRFNPDKEKIRVGDLSEAERRRLENIIEKITKLLWEHRRPGLSQIRLYNQVCLALGGMRKKPKPAVVEKATQDCVKAADRLHRVLRRKDFPPHHEWLICNGHLDNWNTFIECLERAMELTYKKPPKQSDRGKRRCAINAYLLITKFTTERPKRTRGGLFYRVTDLLYQVNYPTADDGNENKLKYICDAVLDRADKGFNPEHERWY
jgi:hypothetical protein